MMYLILTQNLICYIFIYINAAVAQLVERRTENPYVVGSIPTCGTWLLTLVRSHFFLPKSLCYKDLRHIAN